MSLSYGVARVATLSAVCGSPGEHLGSFAVDDAQSIRGLGHLKGPEQGLRSDPRAIEIGQILGDPIKRCVRTVTRPYSEELNSELHGGLLLKRLHSYWPAQGLFGGRGAEMGPVVPSPCGSMAMQSRT
jgi:hypothetical protein